MIPRRARRARLRVCMSRSPAPGEASFTVVLLARLSLAVLAITAPCRPAFAADDAEKAQALFEDGMQLMSKRRYAEACERFAASQDLDPGMGAQYRLAECYEKLGRLASAYEQFRAVEAAADAARKLDRKAVAQRRAEALENRIATLIIEIPKAVADLPGLEVTLDGAVVTKALWGTPVSVDAGDHVVTARATGKHPRQLKVGVACTSKLVVRIDGLEDVARSIFTKPPFVLGAVGGVGVVLGAVTVGLRAGQVSDARDLRDELKARNGSCVGGGEPAFAADCRALSSATSVGDTYGTVSLVSFMVGGAALVGMAISLLLPEPRSAGPAEAGVRFSPVVGAGQSGIVAWGMF